MLQQLSYPLQVKANDIIRLKLNPIISHCTAIVVHIIFLYIHLFSNSYTDCI